MKAKIFIVFAAFFFVAALSILRPVPIVKEDKAIVDKAIVTHIYEGGVKDVVFRTNGDKPLYYINRGLENGLELEDLRKKLVGNEVTFKYPEYWTPLDWNNSIRHVSKVEYNDEIIFNELHS